MSSARFETGYVAFAHGLQGEVGVKTFDPDSPTLLEVERAYLRLRNGEERELVIESVRPTPKALLIHFQGCTRRSDAEALVGAKLSVFREDLPPPQEGEYFLGDLVGLNAQDESGAPLGTVEEIWETGPVPNLVIRRGEEELVIPFAEQFIVSVDLPAGRLTVRPPEYLE